MINKLGKVTASSPHSRGVMPHCPASNNLILSANTKVRLLQSSLSEPFIYTLCCSEMQTIWEFTVHCT